MTSPGIRCVAVALTLLTAAAVGAPSASAEDTPTSTAIVSPTLQFFLFGDTVGLPLLCAQVQSAMVSGAQGLKAEQAATPVVNSFGAGCADFAARGATYLQQGLQAGAGASGLNAVANPAIEALAVGAEQVGANPALGVLGPTVASSGQSLRFFKGSPERHG